MSKEKSTTDTDMIILGIESSCDETAAAIVRGDTQILSHVILSQTKHLEYGGVVPELAARAHLDHIDSVVKEAIGQAQEKHHEPILHSLAGVAATAGPGLIGGVMIGTMFAKSMSLALNVPYIAVNHLEAHALTIRLTHQISYPYLLLLVSGGHTQFVIVHDLGKYEKIGSTIDDAIGEAIDKTGRLLGFSYPAGPQIEQRAKYGNENAYILPRPLFNSIDANFSFSGLKTAVRHLVAEQLIPLSDSFINDLCASFQKTLADILCHKSLKALQLYKEKKSALPEHFVLAGGVAANQYILKKLNETLANQQIKIIAPPISLCTDNAAMVAWVGHEKLRSGQSSSLNFAPKARWPLDEIK